MNTNISLIKLTVFNKVAELLSFTTAADELELSRSMVSQHISQLEQELGVKLFNRTTRRTNLTSAGEELFSVCTESMSNIDTAITNIQQQQIQPSGMIRMTSQTDFGVEFVIPIIQRFMQSYPLIKVELILDDTSIDLYGENIDIAIRLGNLEDSNLYATRIARFDERVFSSPAYFKDKNLPTKPSDLMKYNWITGSRIPNANQWTFFNNNEKSQTVRVKGNVAVNTCEGILTFVRCGAGISVLPKFIVDEKIKSGELIGLLDDYTLDGYDISAVYTQSKQLPNRVRLLIDFLKEQLA